MPTYEYECTSCGYKFDKFHGINDKPTEYCPKCEKKAKKLISSGAGIIFKGTGFYATDYKKKSSGSGSKSCPHSGDSCGGCHKQ